MVWNFDMPGGGPWTLRVENGACKVTEGLHGAPELEMTLTPEYIGVMFGIQNPLPGLLTGKVKIRGFRHLGKMGKLFAQPDPDEVIEPIADN
jgi:putative sterol carrier protein